MTMEDQRKPGNRHDCRNEGKRQTATIVVDGKARGKIVKMKKKAATIVVDGKKRGQRNARRKEGTGA